jgi:TolB protein
VKTIFFILAALFIPSIIHAEQGYLNVTAPGNRQLQLAISSTRSPAGMQTPEIVKDVSDILQFDMTLAGPFSVKAVAGNDGNGIRPGEFDMAPWKAADFDLLVKSSYTISGGNIILECRLYDVLKNMELVAKRYSGNIRELRKIVHSFADEITEGRYWRNRAIYRQDRLCLQEDS